MVTTEMVSSLRVLGKLCSIFFMYYFLPQEILSLITYSQEELLDIIATPTYQHYDQEYDFPEAYSLFGPPSRTTDLIPEYTTLQCPVS
jgi:hypothetical protein